MTKKKEAVKPSASFQDIALNQIKPNPANPRKRGFEGPAFDELVASIRSVGVLEPVLVRAKGKGFELIAGERRYRACCAIAEANGGPKANTIPSIIRDLDDDQAFDAMMIENLQREDLSELEEAEGFKAWVDKRGPESIEDLAQRTGIQPGFIRRRIAVLELPEKALKAWDKGKLSYAHLELLIRIKDKKQRSEVMDRAINGQWSAKELRRSLENKSPSLKKALFDPDQEGCPACFHNTDKQKSLFALEDVDHTVCMKPACFKQKQNNWLSANWKVCALRRTYKTNGFRFYDRGSCRHDGESFYSDKPFTECKECKNFVSLIDVDGAPVHSSGRYCLDPKCKSALEKKRSAEKRKQKTPAAGSGADGQDNGASDDEPRVSWHGEYFREEFLKGVLPSMVINQDMLDTTGLIIAILALVRQGGQALAKACAGLCGLPGKNTPYFFDLPSSRAIEALKAMESTEFGVHRAHKIADVLQLLVADVVMGATFTATDRWAVAELVGIDLAKEWRITEEYLQKKTKSEIMAIGQQFGVFQQEAAQTYLFEKLLKKRGKFDACKKPELIDLFMKSDVDLAGVVPDEILHKKEPREPIDKDDDEPACRVCGCTDDDCSECVEATGEPCHWVEPDLCSRCAAEQNQTATEAA